MLRKRSRSKWTTNVICVQPSRRGPCLCPQVRLSRPQERRPQTVECVAVRCFVHGRNANRCGAVQSVTAGHELNFAEELEMKAMSPEDTAQRGQMSKMLEELKDKLTEDRPSRPASFADGPTAPRPSILRSATVDAGAAALMSEPAETAQSLVSSIEKLPQKLVWCLRVLCVDDVAVEFRLPYLGSTAASRPSSRNFGCAQPGGHAGRVCVIGGGCAGGGQRERERGRGGRRGPALRRCCSRACYSDRAQRTNISPCCAAAVAARDCGHTNTCAHQHV